jgi:hypothetical protein
MNLIESNDDDGSSIWEKKAQPLQLPNVADSLEVSEMD